MPDCTKPIFQSQLLYDEFDVEKPIEVSEDATAEFQFMDLDLSRDVQQAILLTGYTTPTAFQAEIIPFMLDGRDVIGQAQTGTGKTAAFALPILSRLDARSDQRKCWCLHDPRTSDSSCQVVRYLRRVYA